MAVALWHIAFACNGQCRLRQLTWCCNRLVHPTPPHPRGHGLTHQECCHTLICVPSKPYCACLLCACRRVPCNATRGMGSMRGAGAHIAGQARNDVGGGRACT